MMNIVPNMFHIPYMISALVELITFNSLGN